MYYISRLLLIGSLIVIAVGATAQTPPIQPLVQDTPLPPAVVLPVPANVPDDVKNAPLTADEAVAIALKNQPSITAAAAGVQAAQGRKQQVQAGMRPTVETGASYTNTAITPDSNKPGSPVGTATSPGYQVNATLRQLIFDFNHTRDLIRQSKAQINSASYNVNTVRSNLALQVKQAFYNYEQNQRLVAVNETNLRDQQDHLAAAKARLDSGLGLPSDVVRAETAVSNAVFNLNQARNAASTSGVVLAQLMGIDPRTPIVAAESSEPAPADVDVNNLVDKALQQRPEVLQAKWSLQAAGYSVRAAKTSNAPSLGANAGWLQRGDDFPPDGNSLTYGFSIKWTPFDGGATKGRVKEAQANYTTLASQLESTQLQVISDVSQSYLNLTTAEQRVTTAESEVANAQEALRLVSGRYESGLGTFLDVLDAQAALVTAQTNLVNARSTVNQARAAMYRAVGYPVKVS